VTDLPDAGTDPAGFLLGVCEIALADVENARPAERQFITAQVELWRAVVAAESCFGKEFRPVAAAAVGAARAYLTGAQ